MNRLQQNNFFLLVAAALFCASHAHSAERPYRVLETFGVGAEVYVRSLAVDEKHNSIWVGTSVGVHEVDLPTREPRNTFTREQGLANEYVFAMLVDRQGGKWFGTNGGGVSRYWHGKWKTYFPMHGLADYWVYALAEAGDDTVWIGTWYGASHLDPATGQFTNYVDELVNEWVYGVAIDPHQRVWFATEGGVSMFDGEQWTSWTHKDGLGAPNTDNLPISLNTGLGTRSRHDLTVLVDGEPSYNPNYVFCVTVAHDGSIWVGTWGGGVSRFDGEKWTNLTTADGLASNIVFSMTQDAAGDWWFGTRKGLSHYDGKTWQTFSRREGLFGDSVYAVAAAPGGDIWVGTRRGVARIGR
ncbi:MAG TPA: regulator [Gammaproteobacteria bacterium]|nr:regulator [Gammaproteobacteria bacterium]